MANSCNIIRMFRANRPVSHETRSPCPLRWPPHRLNAILSLLHPLDRYRTPSAIGSAIGRPLSRPISHPNTGGSPHRLVLNRLEGSTLNRAIGAIIVSKTPFKQARNKSAIETAILNRPRPRLNSQPQGATKLVRNAAK